MLYVIQYGFNSVPMTAAEDIVYCVSSIQAIIDSGIKFISTDGHAHNALSTEYSMEHSNNLDAILDFKAINAEYWKDDTDLDLKRRKEAEILIEEDLPTKHILGYICYNDNAKAKLIDFGAREDVVVVRPNKYF